MKYEVRRLSAGDFVWICRDKSSHIEVLLPYIVERKRMDDLASSIKDGRFAEQKFRLINCRLANKIYLIESHGNNAHCGLPLQNLLQASTNIQVQSDFTVKYTDKLSDSMFYLSVLTRILTNKFQVKCKTLKIEHSILNLKYFFFFFRIRISASAQLNRSMSFRWIITKISNQKMKLNFFHLKNLLKHQ